MVRSQSSLKQRILTYTPASRRLHGHYFVLSLDKVSKLGAAMFIEVAKDVHLNLRYVVHYEVFDNGPYGRYARFHTVDGKVVDSDATVITVETIQSHMQGYGAGQSTLYSR